MALRHKELVVIYVPEGAETEDGNVFDRDGDVGVFGRIDGSVFCEIEYPNVGVYIEILERDEKRGM